MQFISYIPVILSALAPVLAHPALITVRPPPSICTPNPASNTCTLVWNTNTMAVNKDLSNINNFVAYARVDVFDSSCKKIGNTLNDQDGLKPNMPLYGWGLSNQQPLLLNSVRNDDGVKLPKFQYKGQVYGPSSCTCKDGETVGQPRDTHVCACPFECDLYTMQ